MRQKCPVIGGSNINVMLSIIYSKSYQCLSPDKLCASL